MTTKDTKPKRTGSRKPKRVEATPEAASADAAPEPDASGATAPPAPTPDDSERFADLTRLVVLRMDGQRYALPIEAVQEIQQLVAITEMPGASHAVLGVINLRGRVVPAIDMRALVGLPFREPDLETPMILAYTAYGLVALIVDEVEDVVEVAPESMQAPSGVHALADRLLGVCRLEDGLVFVLDMDVIVPAEAVATMGAGA